jgi:ketopantoate reductase
MCEREVEGLLDRRPLAMMNLPTSVVKAMQSTSVVVAGAGAVGLLIASKLALSGALGLAGDVSVSSRRLSLIGKPACDVRFVGHSKASPPVDISLKVTRLSVLEQAQPDTVIVCAKAYDCSYLLAEIAPQLSSDSSVLVLNNVSCVHSRSSSECSAYRRDAFR